jgi:hypothetical protein
MEDQNSTVVGRVPEIQAGRESVVKVVQLLEETVNILEKRLEHVLSSRAGLANSEETGKPVRPVKSTNLSQFLSDTTDKLYESAKKLENIISRVEL